MTFLRSTAISAAGKPLTLKKQVSAPSTVALQVGLYSKLISGATEFFVLDDAGNEVQVTSGGAVNSGGSSALSFSASVYTGSGIFSTPVGEIAQLDGSGGSLTLQLTSSPTDKDQIGFLITTNVGGGGSISIDGNGKTFSPFGGGSLIYPHGLESLTVLEFSAVLDQWVLMTDANTYLLFLIGSNNSILATGSTGSVNIVNVSNDSLIGRIGSGAIGSIPTGSITGTLPWSGTIFSSTGSFDADPNVINRYTNNPTLNFPATPADGDSIAFKEVGGTSSLVSFVGNGNNIQTDAGINTVEWTTTPYRYAQYKFSSDAGAWLKVNNDPKLVFTATQNSSYSASSWDFVAVDGSASFTVSLMSTPMDSCHIGIKEVMGSGAGTVVVDATPNTIEGGGATETFTASPRFRRIYQWDPLATTWWIIG